MDYEMDDLKELVLVEISLTCDRCGVSAEKFVMGMDATREITELVRTLGHKGWKPKGTHSAKALCPTCSKRPFSGSDTRRIHAGEG